METAKVSLKGGLGTLYLFGAVLLMNVPSLALLTSGNEGTSHFSGKMCCPQVIAKILLKRKKTMVLC